MNLFKQLCVIMWLFKQNIFKLRRINIEEVITYFSVIFYSSHIGCMPLLPLQNLDLFCFFSTSSVILVTDNVTKAPGWYSDGTNKILGRKCC
jgi:hypothetical protein